MGFWKNFWKFVRRNTNKNTEVISKSFGAMLIIWAVAGISILIQLVSGGISDYQTPVILGLGGTSEFLIILIRSIFGKRSNAEETPT